MIEKEYYRLEDLQHRFKMTLSDIKYLLEENKIPLCFHIRRQSFVVGIFRKFDFIGHCSINYDGLVQVGNQYISSICNGKEIKPERFLLLQRHKANYISSEYDWEQTYPNEYIQGWQSKSLNTIEGDFLKAKLYPEFTTSPKWAAGMLAVMGANAFASFKGLKEINAAEFVQEHFNVPEKDLIPNWQFFKLADICVQHNDLIALGVFQPEQTAKVLGAVITPTPSLEPTKTVIQQKTEQEFKNQFHELLARIITKYPLLKPKEIHKLLCNEGKKEEDSRQFDVENILYPETRGIISWRDIYRNNAERSYNLDSLRNEISKVRKKIRYKSAEIGD